MKLILYLLLTATALVAQPYTLDWSTLDGGGGSSSGGGYTIGGTIGQADVGSAGGGDYAIEAGFWPGLIGRSATEPPSLFLRVVDRQLNLSWFPATPGFILEKTGSLNDPEWTVVATENGGNIPLSEETQFYRLKKP